MKIICSKCNKEKPADCFYNDKSKKIGKKRECKECHKSRPNNTSKEARINARLNWLYGIKYTEYKKLYKKQSGCCKICDLPFDVLCVDHNHDTGEVRGLLCSRCNRGLGCFKDDKKLLKSAIKYL